MPRGGVRKDSDSGGFGWAAAIGVGAALIGGAIYLGKKVYDEVKEQKAKEEKLSHSESNKEGACGFNDTNPWRTGKKAKCEQQNTSDYPTSKPPAKTAEPKRLNSWEPAPASLDVQAEPPLQTALEEYYGSYVRISHHRMSRAQNVVDSIKDHVLTHLQMNSKLRVRRLFGTGSSAEGLKVINPDEFDVEIHLDINPELLDIGEDENVPGYVMLELCSTSEPYSYFATKSIANDSVSYLNPQEVHRYFRTLIREAMKDIDRYVIDGPSDQSADIKVKVEFDEANLVIDFTPVVLFRNHHFVAKPHPEFMKGENGEYETFWRASFSRQEKKQLDRLQSDCHKKLLKIIKAIRENNPSYLGMFSSFTLKNVILHMVDDSFPEEWGDDMLQERFIDFLKRFEEYLVHGHLPHFYVRELNLFERFRPNELENAKLFLQKKISKGALESLLKKDKTKF